MINKPYISIFFCIACALLLSGCEHNKDTIETQIGTQKYSLEIARSDIERSNGLSDRKQLAANSGMLFVFESKSTQTFWMRETLIPLQIIYLDECKIVDIQNMTVEPDPSAPTATYTSKAPADMAVELNANSVSKDLIGTKINDLCNDPIINAK